MVGGSFQTEGGVSIQRHRDVKRHLGSGHSNREAGMCATHQGMERSETREVAGGPRRGFYDVMGSH